MKVWTYSICWNEARMAPWFLRHYEPWVDRMVVYLEPSTDDTEKILSACPKVEIRPWLSQGLDDEKFLATVNESYLDARGKCDWVAFVDLDELLFHPDMKRVLEAADGDIFRSTGYALISKTGWPDLKNRGQLYEHVPTGVRQPNFDKLLLARPSLNLQHTIGRHTYPGAWPKHKGQVASSVLTLLHAHHVGGVEDTARRNRRNYARARDKKFAWNYEPTTEANPTQVGTVAWVKHALGNGQMQDVVFASGAQLAKYHLGSGGKNIDGWRNHDIEIDLRKPLPFPNESASHMLAEHVIEHVTHKEAWCFMEECYRVLARGGIVRIAIPDFARLTSEISDEYRLAVKSGGHGDGSIKSCLRAMVFEHGHQAVWTEQLLVHMLEAVGFKATPFDYSQSQDSQLVNVEQHWKTVGLGVAKCETSVVEGLKP